MNRLIFYVLLTSPMFAADYVNVCLTIDAPKEWQSNIKDNLEAKLNAIPDVQVVEKADEAAFTILVDVNAVSNKTDEVIGYSLAAVVLGTYDNKILTLVFDEAEKTKLTAEEKAWMPVMKYAVSGNVFLAGFVHTHGSLDNIDAAYDQIVAKLKSKGMPEYRKMIKMIGEAVKRTGAGAALPTLRQE